MNIYDALNLAEMSGHRASLQSDGRWFLIRKSDRAIVNIGYSIIEAVSVLVEAEPEVVEAEPVVETVETVDVVADAATTEVEAEVVQTVNLSNYDIVTLAEVNGFRVSLQANGEWHLIRKSDRQVTVVGYNLKDAVAIINPTPKTMSQVEIERGYAAQEAEEHAAWVESQTEEVVDVLDEIDESGDHGHAATVEVLCTLCSTLPEAKRGFWDGTGTALAVRPRGGVRGASATGDTAVTLDDLEAVLITWRPA